MANVRSTIDFFVRAPPVLPAIRTFWLRADNPFLGIAGHVHFAGGLHCPTQGKDGRWFHGANLAENVQQFGVSYFTSKPVFQTSKNGIERSIFKAVIIISDCERK